ncbi:signal recognition particle receptor subunit alpha [Pancytospora philotis]|nr:signal recognition particle receptor subunit alpha [Pancytospora philotis]
MNSYVELGRFLLLPYKPYFPSRMQTRRCASADVKVLRRKPMQYFTIFNKKGFVLFEAGKQPAFLNSLVQSISPQNPVFTKKIKDDIVECEIRDQIVYLSIGRTPALKALVAKYEPAVLTLGDNEMLTAEHVDALRGDAASKPSGPAQRDADASDSLNYSETQSVVSSIAESIRAVDVKRVFSLFSGRIAADALSSRMNDFLITKNVDPSFSKLITDDVTAGFRSRGMAEVSEGEFKAAVADELRKVIPAFGHDAFLERIRSHDGPYVICFVGVNGVGKSTSLAKVACWLIRAGLRVYIAACDTFRAGAVEQLQVHVDRFKVGGHSVGFYESGYSKDDACVARAAIQRARSEDYDVVLIDTAGRMHNKEHLMQSLSKLIKMNAPDHIIFVGEALVGGDSLSHIKEFNKWIDEGCQGRRIDSILLTKVDTVDSKIGQVLNLSFSASAPVMFLGMGQANSDLAPMDPAQITELLTSQ